MDTKNIYITYKIVRLIFGFFILSFFVFFPVSFTLHKNVIIILLIYIVTAGISLFGNQKRIDVFDFLLDIIFISALIYINYDLLNYLIIIYLFPIFIYAYLTGKKHSYLLSVISFITYSYISFLNTGLEFQTVINLLFAGFSMFSLNYAGLYMHKKVKEKSVYISILEEESKKNEIFQKLYRISADFAHELRNPLTSILAAVELIDDERHKNKMVNIIKTEGKRIENLLNTFLTFSKSIDKNFSDTNIYFVVKEIINSIDNPENKVISININKDINAYTSESSIKVVLKNIIENAIFWAKKNVLISTEQKGNKIYIYIEDDGKGIEKEDYDKVFEPFFTRRAKGTGLGLSIAKKYIMELGGNIKVEKSKLGGAKFIIWLPIGYENG